MRNLEMDMHGKIDGKSWTGLVALAGADHILHGNIQSDCGNSQEPNSDLTLQHMCKQTRINQTVINRELNNELLKEKNRQPDQSSATLKPG